MTIDNWTIDNGRMDKGGKETNKCNYSNMTFAVDAEMLRSNTTLVQWLNQSITNL